MMTNNMSVSLSVDGVLEQSIKGIDIPPRPLIIDRVRAAMNEEVPNFKRVGELISADVSLAAGLIKTANSPYFGCQSRARSINEALLMLGLDVTCLPSACARLFPIVPITNVSGMPRRRLQCSQAGWLAVSKGPGYGLTMPTPTVYSATAELSFCCGAFLTTK